MEGSLSLTTPMADMVTPANQLHSNVMTIQINIITNKKRMTVQLRIHLLLSNLRRRKEEAEVDPRALQVNSQGKLQVNSQGKGEDQGRMVLLLSQNELEGKRHSPKLRSLNQWFQGLPLRLQGEENHLR